MELFYFSGLSEDVPVWVRYVIYLWMIGTVVFVLGALVPFVERKLAADFQARVGPNRTGPRGFRSHFWTHARGNFRNMLKCNSGNFCMYGFSLVVCYVMCRRGVPRERSSLLVSHGNLTIADFLAEGVQARVSRSE